MLFHLKGEDEVPEEVNLKDQAAHTANVSSGDVPTVAKTDNNDEPVQYGTAEEPMLFAIAGAALERLGLMNPYAKSALYACQTETCLLKQAALRQTKILDHFKFL